MTFTYEDESTSCGSQQVSPGRRVYFESNDLDDVDLELDLGAASQDVDEITVPSTLNQSPTRPAKCQTKRRVLRKRRDVSLERYSKSIHCWGHGLKTTCATVALAWTGTVLAVLARQSTEFLVLRDPLYLSTIYNPVEYVGLLRMELCFNETASEELSGCQIIQLDESTSSDTMMTLARLFLVSSVVSGGFFTLFLTLAMVWESIRMKPIGFGLLATYFLQSFTMLAFDSTICTTHHCWIGRGCYICVAAAICWLGACIGAAKMESEKWKLRRKRRKLFHKRLRKAREAAVAMKVAKEKLNITSPTATLSDTSSDGNPDDLDPELCII